MPRSDPAPERPAHGRHRAGVAPAARRLRTAPPSPGRPDDRGSSDHRGPQFVDFDICVAAHHGPRVTIRKLAFPGRSAVDEKTILNEVRGGSDVNHPGGIYDADVLAYDILRIKALYWERGKANVDILEPKLERHGSTIDVALPIKEGPTFHYGAIAITAIGARADQLAIRPGQRFSRDRVAAVVSAAGAVGGSRPSDG